jgi:hypothetical protein
MGWVGKGAVANVGSGRPRWVPDAGERGGKLVTVAEGSSIPAQLALWYVESVSIGLWHGAKPQAASTAVWRQRRKGRHRGHTSIYSGWFERRQKVKGQGVVNL